MKLDLILQYWIIIYVICDCYYEGIFTEIFELEICILHLEKAVRWS